MPHTQDGTVYALVMVQDCDRDALTLARQAIAYALRNGWNPTRIKPEAAVICLDRLAEDYDARVSDAN